MKIFGEFLLYNLIHNSKEVKEGNLYKIFLCVLPSEIIKEGDGFLQKQEKGFNFLGGE